jgi:hypothetical protein
MEGMEHIDNNINNSEINLHKVLNLSQQYELIRAVNNFLGSMDVSHTQDPYLQFSSTIDENGCLVLLKRSVTLSRIDLKHLFTKQFQESLLKTLEIFLSPEKATEIVNNFKQNIMENFKASSHSHGLPNLKYIGLKDTKSSTKDKMVLAYINQMLGNKRNDYFSMKKKWVHDEQSLEQNMLFLNEKWCRYFTYLLAELKQYITHYKWFIQFDELINWLGKDDQVKLSCVLEKINIYLSCDASDRAKYVLTDEEILTFFSTLYWSSRKSYDMIFRGKVWFMNDLLYACHHVYHGNNYDFYELQVRPDLDKFNEFITNAWNETSETFLKKNNNINIDTTQWAYLMFHEWPIIKWIISWWLKSLWWTDTFNDILRWRTIINKEYFARNSKLLDWIVRARDFTCSLFSNIHNAILDFAKHIDLKDIVITGELDIKYKDLKSYDEDFKDTINSSDNSSENRCKIRSRSSAKTMKPNSENIKDTKDTLAFSTMNDATLSDLYDALHARKKPLTWYEDMKMIYMIQWIDRYWTKTSFWYEHMVVFSDYSNEHPDASHTAKLDPFKVIRAINKDMAYSSQREYYNIMAAGFKDLVKEQKSQKQYLEQYKENKSQLYINQYPYNYVQEQFTCNDILTLWNEKYLLSDIDVDSKEDQKILHKYIAQAYQDFCKESKFQLIIRKEDVEMLKNTQYFDDTYGTDQWWYRIWNTNKIADFVYNLDQKKLQSMHQCNGDISKKLITWTIPNDGELWVVIGEKIFRIAIDKASYLLRQLDPVWKDKMKIDLHTGSILPYEIVDKKLTN